MVVSMFILGIARGIQADLALLSIAKYPGISFGRYT